MVKVIGGKKPKSTYLKTQLQPAKLIVAGSAKLVDALYSPAVLTENPIFNEIIIQAFG